MSNVDDPGRSRLRVGAARETTVTHPGEVGARKEGNAGLTKTEKIVCLDLDVLFTLEGTNTMEKRKYTGRIMALAAAGMIVFGTAGIDASAAPTRGTQSGTTAQKERARATTPAPAPMMGRTAPANPALGQTPPPDNANQLSERPGVPSVSRSSAIAISRSSSTSPASDSSTLLSASSPKTSSL